MNSTITRKQNIRNPEKWVGKVVINMANWWDYKWAYESGYFVCEWTGKLTRVEDEFHATSFEELEALQAIGFDECYSYSTAAVLAARR